MLDEALVQQYKAHVCAPEGHAHGSRPEEILRCVLSYLARVDPAPRDDHGKQVP